MTDHGPKTVFTAQDISMWISQAYNTYLAEQAGRNVGGASSSNTSNLGNVKKTPKKKRQATSKKLTTLKNQFARDKAKLAETRKKLRDAKLLENLEKAETRLKKENERIRSLKEKLNVSTGPADIN